MKKLISILLFNTYLALFNSVALAATTQAAEHFQPTSLIKLDPVFAHHVLVAEKSTHMLYLYENREGQAHLLKSYQMATGKNAGNKIFQGDHRTPEGIYFITDFIPKEDLLKRYGKEGEIYGVGSFVMDYPNPIDRRQGKTGGGIWVHSTNDETRIEKGLDSRGCIVTANENLKEISQYIELDRTAVVIVHHLDYLRSDTWKSEARALENSFEVWLKAWQEENIEAYLASYHPNFTDSVRGDVKQFSQYKRAVFSNPGKPEINAQHVSILRSEDYATVSFVQDYRSPSINDRGRKVLYFKRDEYYQWKIISENWTKSGLREGEKILGEATVAFRPSMRFFKDELPQSSRN
jgi:murein L,D-transpeptidase YafK